MIELGLEYQQIRIAGRGAKSAFWRQLISDVTGVPACRFLNDEGPAMGAVFHAAVSYFREMGQYISYSELTKRLILLDDESFCDPRAERYDYYLEKLSRQQYLVETLVGTGFLD
jgi:xylulokinase